MLQTCFLADEFDSNCDHAKSHLFDPSLMTPTLVAQEDISVDKVGKEDSTVIRH
jgi:hypothetical protein